MYSALADQFGANMYSMPPPMVYPEWTWLSESVTPSAVSGQLVISPGIAALGVEQRRIHRDADTAGNASKCVDLVFPRDRHDADKPCLAILDAGAGGIDLDTEHELAARELPVVADRATPETAAVVAVKGIAAHRADIEAGPVVSPETAAAPWCRAAPRDQRPRLRSSAKGEPRLQEVVSSLFIPCS